MIKLQNRSEWAFVAIKDGDDDNDAVAIVGVTIFVIDGAFARVVTIYDADRSTSLMGLP